MLEAYSDLSDAEGIEFKIDPYRKWHVLESQSYSGDLITNIFAGGTIEYHYRSNYSSYNSFLIYRIFYIIFNFFLFIKNKKHYY